MRGRIVGVVYLLAMMFACQLKGERTSHELVGPSGETLRAAFNGDAGKVRMVVLLSPT